MLPFGIGAKYWLYDRNYKTVQTAKNLSIPVFLMQGQRDYNVTMKDYDIWLKEMQGKTNFSFKILS